LSLICIWLWSKCCLVVNCELNCLSFCLMLILCYYLLNLGLCRSYFRLYMHWNVCGHPKPEQAFWKCLWFLNHLVWLNVHNLRNSKWLICPWIISWCFAGYLWIWYCLCENWNFLKFVYVCDEKRLTKSIYAQKSKFVVVQWINLILFYFIIGVLIWPIWSAGPIKQQLTISLWSKTFPKSQHL